MEEFYNAIKSMAAPPLPLESYIYNILYEVPALPAGRSLSFNAITETIVCQRPANGELPLCDYSMKEFFELLGVEHVMELMTCAFLESQILLVSKGKKNKIYIFVTDLGFVSCGTHPLD